MDHTHFQTIVVGVDFSTYSKIVVKQASQMAKEYKAQLILVHTLNSASFMSGQFPFVDLEDEFIQPLTKEVISFYKLKNLIAEMKLEAKVVVNIGRPAEGIIAIAKQQDHPLIVVGHKGKSTFMGRFFIGSTAEQLALHSPFPVWIHRGNDVKFPKKILLPCDFSKRSTTSLAAAQSLNGLPKTKYEFFHVIQEPLPVLDINQWKQRMNEIKRQESAHQREFRKRFPQIPLKSVTGEAAPLIAKESKKFDLIAMAPHSREGLFAGFGSVTAKVVRSGDTPVLITR